MAKHRRTRRQNNQPKSHDRTDSCAFNDRGSIAWDVAHHRRESRLGSHLIPNARHEHQPAFSRPWREHQRPHYHQPSDSRHFHHRTFSTTSTLQHPHTPVRHTRKSDHIIRDLFVQGSVIEQKLKRLMEGLQNLQPADEEMEWEGTNSIYYVPLALANVVGGDGGKTDAHADAGAGAGAVASELVREGSASALGQGLGHGDGLRRARLASLLAPPAAVSPSKLPFQMSFDKALALRPAGARWAGGQRSGSW